MEKYLPEVSKEVAFSTSANILECSNDEYYVKKQIEEIREVNPVVAEWIKKFSEKTEDFVGSAMCGIIVYKMIYSQAEAKLMNEHFA